MNLSLLTGQWETSEPVTPFAGVTPRNSEPGTLAEPVGKAVNLSLFVVLSPPARECERSFPQTLPWSRNDLRMAPLKLLHSEPDTHSGDFGADAVGDRAKAHTMVVNLDLSLRPGPRNIRVQPAQRGRTPECTLPGTQNKWAPEFRSPCRFRPADWIPTGGDYWYLITRLAPLALIEMFAEPFTR